MADLAVVAAEVGVINPRDAEMGFMTCASATTAGQTLYRDANGDGEIADANVAGAQQTRALALEAGAAGQTISVLFRGLVEGFTVAQAYDAPLYQSDTAGAIADAAGTLTVPVGIVTAINDGGGTPSKVVYFNPRSREDYA